MARTAPLTAGKLLDLLELTAREPGLSLATLASRTGQPKSTCFRLLAALVERGYVCQSKRGSFLTGPALARIAINTDERELQAHWCRSHVSALAKELNVTAHLGVLEGDMATYVVKHRAGRIHVRSFERTQLEAYCSAIGKVLLASMEPDRFEAYLQQGEFIALTETTITDPDLLRREIDAARERGWAIDDGEIYSEIACISVPVRDRSGHIVAALSASFNRMEWPASSLSVHVQQLEATAAKIAPAFA